MMLTRIANTILVLSVSAFCAKTEDQLSRLSPIIGDEALPQVVGVLPYTGQLGVPPTQVVQFLFSKDMNTQRCISAFSILAQPPGTVPVPLVGFFQGTGPAMSFTPSAPFGIGSYGITLTRDCEDVTGRDLQLDFHTSFAVGTSAQLTKPQVVAMGLESQTNCTSPGAVGSVTGGNWTLTSCWWDSTLAVLTPANYQYRGGDSAGCADTTTDNFRMIFNNYMDPATTLNAISLRRLSAYTNGSTTIRLGRAVWGDCQAASPYGCRMVTLSYAESEAACNGASFGTVGDFDLTATAGSPAAFPLYMLQMDTTALDVTGQNPIAAFNFAITGN